MLVTSARAASRLVPRRGPTSLPPSPWRAARRTYAAQPTPPRPRQSSGNTSTFSPWSSSSSPSTALGVAAVAAAALAFAATSSRSAHVRLDGETSAPAKRGSFAERMRTGSRGPRTFLRPAEVVEEPEVEEEEEEDKAGSSAGDEEQAQQERRDLGELEQEAGQEAAFDPETNTINWDCPCLGGMAHGPCGEEFKDAFSCFVFSEKEPKGIECVEKFKVMQDCFRRHPEVYKEELKEDEWEEAEQSAEGAEKGQSLGVDVGERQAGGA